MSWLKRLLGSGAQRPTGDRPRLVDLQHGEQAANLRARVELLLARGAAREARTAAEEATNQFPEDTALSALCARACLAAGDAESALDHVTLALHRDPRNELAFETQVAALERAGRQREIPAVCEEFLRASPDHAGASLRLARAAHAARDFDRAAALFAQVLEREPRNGAALNDLGLLLAREFGQFQRGEALLRRALETAPQSAEAAANLAWVRCEQGAWDEGLQLFDAQLARAPDDSELRLMRAVALLKHGDFAAGWEEYESRVASPAAIRRPYRFPSWDGGSVPEGALLVYGEQGLGDEIMFASCLPDLLARVPDCVVECDARLGRLFQRSWPSVRVVTGAQGDPAPAWLAEPGSVAARVRAQVAIGSLPRWFRRNLADFPTHTGFLRADPGRVRAWRQRPAVRPDHLRVGISWRGGTPTTRRALRSLEVAQLAPMLAAVPATWISLQYTDCRAELDQLARHHGVAVHHWQEAIDDYDETAALVASLDAVVTVCTAIAHLSGALGQRTLVMTPYAAEWRYGASGDTMAWYPSVRLLRQRTPGVWTDVLARVTHELAAGASPV